LEVRVPMLGNPVLDAVLAMPAAVHYDAVGGKALLRALAARHLPEAAWKREKHGFSVPLLDLFNGAWREAAADVLQRCESLAPFLRADMVRSHWTSALRGRGSRRLAYTF